MPSLQATNFNLATALESGQLFRYWPHDGGYVIGQREKLFFIRQDHEHLEVEGCSKEFVRSFFRLDDPLDSILKPYRADPVLRPAIASCTGLRILAQDPFECLIGFMCSSASNIPKIKRNMNQMARSFGQLASIKGFETHTFPGPGDIHDLAKISASGTGYRAPFIHAANEMVTDQWLSSLSTLPYTKAKENLMTIPGVGSKIADCVLLFSLGFNQAFPVDVWIERAVHELYPYTKRLSQSKLEGYCRKRFGNNAGYVQQYLYHWKRTGGLRLHPKINRRNI